MATSEPAWLQSFPGLKQLPADLLDKLVSESTVVSLPSGSRIYGPGQAPESFILLLDGTVRVQQVSETGREIVLYRVSAGDSCALTTACLMGYEDYLAEAIVEDNTRAVAIPRATFDDLISASAIFRRFVFTAFSARVTELFRVIDQVAFARLDIRLAHKLLELSNGSDHLETTQQVLASELGTSREVVSRILGEFQRRRWIASARGRLAILDPDALENLSRER